MANTWGNNVLAPGAKTGWYFTRLQIIEGPNQTPLPCINVHALTDGGDDNSWHTTGDGYPYFNQLGVSTQWNMVSHGEGGARDYLLVVINNSVNSVAYEFIEADL
jgi:hypothetical protein